MLVDGSYKSLLQGMSQQPDRARLDGQCTLMENMVADAVDGLRRRSPINYIKNIGDYHADNKIYDYNTGIEQYAIIFNTDKTIDIFDLDGTAKTVNNQGASYLSTTPKQDLRLVTIGDYTIVTNKEKVTALTSDVHAPTSSALIYFKDGGEYGRKYEVKVDGIVRAEYTTPGGATPDTQAQKTGTSYVANEIFTDLFTWSGARTESYTFDFTSNTYSQGKGYTIDGMTAISDIDVVNGTAIAAAFEAHAVSGLATTVHGFVTVFGGIWTPAWTVTKSGYILNMVSNTPFTNVPDIVHSTYYGSTPIITHVEGSSTGIGSGYSFELKENVILAKRTSGTTPIDISISDDRGGYFALIVQDEIKKSSSLPLYAEVGMITVITGEGTKDSDDIYMEATGSGIGLQEVVWRETVKRDLQYKFDIATMPHVLVRLLDGTFYFGPLDGATYGGTEIEKWRERDAGNDDSNPVRAFIGKPIEFVTSFQERLVMLSGDFLIMSSTNSFFNFWNTTATALLDSDPIELANPATEATSLKVALQQNKNLIVFSDDTQFIVGGAQGITPKTAAMSIATAFQADLTSMPVAAGSKVFFGITYGTYGGIREMFTDSVTAAQDSRKITEHIKRLISGNITHMKVDSNLGVLAVLTDTDQDRVYIYQYLWDGENRLQSAWSYWTLGGSNVEHFFFKGSDFYFLAHDPATDTYCFGNMDTADTAETGLDFNVYLDRKSTATPDVNRQFTMTDCIIPEEDLVVVRAANSDYPGMTAQVESVSVGVVTLVDAVGGDVIYGRTYKSRFKPTMPQLKDQNGVVLATDRLIVNSFNISYKNTGEFKVRVSDEWSVPTEQEFTGRVTGDINNLVGEFNISSGVLKAGIRKDRDLAEVEIYTESYLPMALIDIEWTGQFTKRGRRF